MPTWMLRSPLYTTGSISFAGYSTRCGNPLMPPISACSFATPSIFAMVTDGTLRSCLASFCHVGANALQCPATDQSMIANSEAQVVSRLEGCMAQHCISIRMCISYRPGSQTDALYCHPGHLSLHFPDKSQKARSVKEGPPSMPSKQKNASICCLALALIMPTRGKAFQAARSHAQAWLAAGTQKA